MSAVLKGLICDLELLTGKKLPFAQREYSSSLSEDGSVLFFNRNFHPNLALIIINETV